MTYDISEYGEIINGPGTYEAAAFDLIERGHVVLNYIDQRGSLFNVLLSYAPTRVGAPGGLVDEGPKLWVGIAGKGLMGFRLGDRDIAWPYVSEKLDIMGGSAQPVAELINNVLSNLALAIS